MQKTARKCMRTESADLAAPLQPSRLAGILCALVLPIVLACSGCRADRNPARPLDRVGAILDLSEQELSAGQRVQLRGVVTLLDPTWHLMAVQDASGGILVDMPHGTAGLALGTLVEVAGATSIDNHLPSIVTATVRTLGTGKMPEPQQVPLRLAARGAALYKRIEVELTPRQGVLADLMHTAWFDTRVDGRDFEIVGRQFRRFRPGMLDGRRIRVRGVAMAFYSPAGELDHVRLMFDDESDVDVLEGYKPAPAQPAAATGAALAPLTSVKALKQLPRAEIERGHPVSIEGVVTAYLPEHGGIVVQQEGYGLYVFLSPQRHVEIRPGTRIRVIGRTAAGGFGPVVQESDLQMLGRASMPAPQRVNTGEVFRGAQENAWVEIEGVATSVTLQKQVWTLQLFSGTRRVDAWFSHCDDAAALTPYVNARVSVQGALGPVFNATGTLIGLRILAEDPRQIRVIEPAPAGSEPRSIASLGGFDFRGTPVRRIRTRGTVTYRDAVGRVYLQEGATALRVISDGVNEPPLGTLAEVEGFIAPDTPEPQLEEAHWTGYASGSAIAPRPVLVEAMLAGEVDGRLVSVEGFLENRRTASGLLDLRLQTGHGAFSALLEAPGSAAGLPELRPGAMLRLTGICETQPGRNLPDERVATVRLRTLSDLVLLTPAPWWDLRRALYAAFATTALLILALIWVARLRQNVLSQMELRSELEQQLLHSRKLESVGQLAGGVAHDFNNYLTVIVGYSSMLLEQFPTGHPAHAQLQAIRDVSDKAAALTRQLLAFSRRQVLQPVLCDLNALLAEAQKTVLPLVGDHIELCIRRADKLDLVNVDPAQFTQVLMNLAVNARDAMPQGGRLTIETENVELDAEYALRHAGIAAGRYVHFSVADNGPGMDEAMLGRIFEPFFTTKGKGHGTGLGLAVVFGIVKQSGGHLEVQSRSGEGTTFHMYLPAAAAGGTQKEPAGDVVVAGGGESILVVEDQPQVRGLVCAGLRAYGYRVIETDSPSSALDLAASSDTPLDLLLTDLVMPEMSGQELAAEILAWRPDIGVLYMSGYSEEINTRGGVLTPGTAYLQKPFSPAQAAAAVRRALDARTR